MKNLITVLALTFGIVGFAQTKNVKGDVSFKIEKIENFKIAVEVDSVEEIESTFTIQDFEEILCESTNNEDITFSMRCNDSKMKNGLKSYVKYEIKGNTKDKEDFLKKIAKVRKAAIKYYKSK